MACSPGSDRLTNNCEFSVFCAWFEVPQWYWFLYLLFIGCLQGREIWPVVGLAVFLKNKKLTNLFIFKVTLMEICLLIFFFKGSDSMFSIWKIICKGLFQEFCLFLYRPARNFSIHSWKLLQVFLQEYVLRDAKQKRVLNFFCLSLLC